MAKRALVWVLLLLVLVLVSLSELLCMASSRAVCASLAPAKASQRRSTDGQTDSFLLNAQRLNEVVPSTERAALLVGYYLVPVNKKHNDAMALAKSTSDKVNSASRHPSQSPSSQS